MYISLFVAYLCCFVTDVCSEVVFCQPRYLGLKIKVTYFYQIFFNAFCIMDCFEMNEYLLIWFSKPTARVSRNKKGLVR